MAWWSSARVRPRAWRSAGVAPDRCSASSRVICSSTQRLVFWPLGVSARTPEHGLATPREQYAEILAARAHEAGPQPYPRHHHEPLVAFPA